MSPIDAVVVGSGPNGLAAAAMLARIGLGVQVLEAQEQIGGGCRTMEMTLPGFLHDHCAAVHPLGASSPVFRALGLERLGLSWVRPPIQVAHPLDDGSAAVVTTSVEDTVSHMGADGDAWRRLVGSRAANWDEFANLWLSPIWRLSAQSRHTIAFAPSAAMPVTRLAERNFGEEHAKAALAGFAAHTGLPLDHPFTGAVGVLFNVAAHAVGMPFAQGGSQSIAEALAHVVQDAGGEIRTGSPVRSMRDVPPARFTFLDLTPTQIFALAGDRLAPRVRRAFRRYRHGTASFKIDFALAEPVPWKAAACHSAGTLHIGGTLREIAEAERTVNAGGHPDRPFLLAAQPTVCDPHRAPEGRQVLWTYTHVPWGSTRDISENVSAQIERFAPGFRDVVLASSVTSPTRFHRDNANHIGGDVAGGDLRGRRLFLRPRVSWDPWRLGDGMYLCSQSSPPGSGVHGMCGYWAVRSALGGKTVDRALSLLPPRCAGRGAKSLRAGSRTRS